VIPLLTVIRCSCPEDRVLGTERSGDRMESEQPDWGFWTFVIALIQLALDAMK
jgi:hypothetical protein